MIVNPEVRTRPLPKGDEKRHGRRQDKAKSDEKAEFTAGVNSYPKPYFSNKRKLRVCQYDMSGVL
jgi:hypothetical protein